MKKLVAVAGMFFIFFFAVFSPMGFAMDEKEKTEITNTINAMMKEIIGAAERGDVEKTFANLSPGKDAVYYLNDRSYDSPALLDFFKKEYAKIASQKIDPAQSRVMVFSSDAAAWVGHGNGYTVDPSGKQTPFSFAETWIFQKVDGNWSITHYHESTRE